MAVERYLITLDKNLAIKLKQKARRRGFEDVREYITHLVYHHIYHGGGRPRTLVFDTIAEKFAAHTKESRKRLRTVRGLGL